MKMQVVRIENLKGEGMYRTREDFISLYDYPCFTDDDERNHPTPSNKIFSYLLKNPEFIFGFRSAKMMKTWLYEKDWCLFLDDAGFSYCTFEIDSEFVILDKRQLIFNRDKAEIVFCGSITEQWDSIS